MNKEKYKDSTADKAIAHVSRMEQVKKQAEEGAFICIQYMIRNGVSKQEMVRIINHAYKRVREKKKRW